MLTTKPTLTAVLVSFGFACALASPARAGAIVSTLPTYYDSPNGYDFSITFPPPGSTIIGSLAFTIPSGATVLGATITGTFGNPDVTNTALSDYFLGFGGDETAVEVAACDNVGEDCYSGQNGPYTWSYTLTAGNLSTLASAIAAGSLDFTYTWVNNTAVTTIGDQFVYAGDPTLTITVSPEPASLLLMFGGLAVLVAIRRFRRA